jgi:hypothetical protein
MMRRLTEGIVQRYRQQRPGLFKCVFQEDKGRFESDEVYGTELAIEGLRLMDTMVESSESGQWVGVNR